MQISGCVCVCVCGGGVTQVWLIVDSTEFSKVHSIYKG